MKSFGNMIKLLTLAFVCIFFLNMFIMHVFFNIDVFNPVSGDELEADITEMRFIPENTTDSYEEPEEVYPEITTAASDYYSQDNIDDEAVLERDSVDTAGEAEETDSTYYMTTSEVGFLENLSMMDKLEVLSLFSKVGREESDRIYDLAMDGITYAEMRDIEVILMKYLDKNEMKTLTGLLDKNKKQFSN